MKKVLILPVLLLALFCAHAQPARAQEKHPASDQQTGPVSSDHSNNARKEQSAERSTDPASKAAEHADKKEAEKTSASSTASVTTLDAGGSGDASNATTDAPIKSTPTVPVAAGTASSSSSGSPATPVPSNNAGGSSNGSNVTSGVSSGNNATAAAPLPSSIYRVGAGDVLDIRLLNASSRESTLYTVMAGGLLEYPLAGPPMQVAGLTTDEIAARLASSVKVYDNPRFIVGVREYASHSLIVTGLVGNPGPRILRREAMPLYVVLAEAQPHPEAARAIIMRTGAENLSVDLSDSAATSTLVQPGDVIKVTTAPPAPPQFYFIGGQVNSPGQKDFHAGLTLTQAILASGGISRFANSKIKVSRQGTDGRLVTAEYNLKQIEEGKIPDPALRPGDRVEVGRGHW